MKVLLLKGGLSAEREVSLLSGAAVERALVEKGHQVEVLDITDWREAIGRLLASDAEVVFNALHGKQGEDGCLQGVLNLIGKPYTHSGVVTSSVAMDKTLTKRLLEAAGLRVPGGGLFSREQLLKEEPFARPFIVKPNDDGSSKGILLIKPEDSADALAQSEWPFAGVALVEEFIPGRELTVAVLDDRPLAVTELVASGAFYDFEAKYTAGRTTHIVPAELPERVYQAALEQALVAHRAVGGRSLTRTDFRYWPEKADDDWSGLYILEINTQPGMTSLSLAPEQAQHCGLAFPDLVDHLVRTARID